MAEAEKKAIEAKEETGGKAAAQEAKAPAPAAEKAKQEQPGAPKPVEKARETASGKPAARTKAKSAVSRARKKTAAPKSSVKKSSKPKTGKTAVKATAKKARTAKAGTAKTAKRVETTAKATTFKKVESNMTKTAYNFDKLTQEAQNSGKEGIEAIVQSGSIFAKGFEDILKTYVTLAQESAERNSQAVKTILGSRTLNEFTEAQSRIARENFDDFLAGVTKISELSVKVTTEALEPINDQFSKTIRKVSEAAAA